MLIRDSASDATAIRGPLSPDVIQSATWRYPLKRGAPERLRIANLAEWNDRTKPARPIFPPIPPGDEAIGKRPPRLRRRDLERFGFGSGVEQRGSRAHVDLVYRAVLAYDWNRWDAEQLHLLLVKRGPLAEATASMDPFQRRCEEATTVLSSFLHHALARIATREKEHRRLESEVERRVYKELVARNAASPEWTVCEWCARLLRRSGTRRVRCRHCNPSRFARAVSGHTRIPA